MVLKNKKRFLSVLLLMAVVSSVYRIPTCQSISAKSKEVEKESETGSVKLAVVTGDGEISMSPTMQCLANLSGVVCGDGVRLRKGASLTATVLEMMDKGELVTIYVDQSKLSRGFYYVKRIKTGTKGYASTKYIRYR